MKRELHRGFLVAVEGIDGAGKTTQVARLADAMKKEGLDVVVSKEPTNGKWGSLLRRSATEGRLSPEAELAAFLEDRKEHVAELIRPALERRALVILDRYYFSTMAYQGLHGVDPEHLRQLNEEFAPVPDLLVILDLDPEASLARIEGRGDQANHFERVHLLEQSREIFQRYIEPNPRRSPDGRQCWVYRVDASRPVEEIASDIRIRLIQVAFETIAAELKSGDEAIKAAMRLNGVPVTP